MPSSRRRGWYCSAAARLQPPVDERPARTAPGLVRPYLSRTRARRRGRARRSPASRGRRGASFFYADREHGRARRARWAARIPPIPSPRHLLPRTAQHLAAHHPAHRRSIGRPSPLSRARGPRAAQRAMPPRLPTRAAAWGFEPASATPGRTGGARGRGPPTGVPGGFARPRRQLSPEGPARARSTPPRLGVGALAFGSVGPAIPSCTEDSVDSVMPRSLEFGIKNCEHIWRASHLWAVGAPRKVSYKWLLGRRPSAAPCPAPRA